MKIMALEVERPGTAPTQFAPLLTAEAYAVWELHQAGVIRELYFRADKHESVLVLECVSLDEARATLQRLPLVQAGLIAFDLIPLVAYPGFARLFGGEHLRK